MRKPVKTSEKKFKKLSDIGHYKNITFSSRYGDNQIAIAPAIFPEFDEHHKNISQVYFSSYIQRKGYVNNRERLFTGAILSIN